MLDGRQWLGISRKVCVAVAPLLAPWHDVDDVRIDDAGTPHLHLPDNIPDGTVWLSQCSWRSAPVASVLDRGWLRIAPPWLP